MTTSTDTAQKDKHAITDLDPALERGPVWLREYRREARQAFNDAPVPPRGLHLWRYTDPQKFLIDTDNYDASIGELSDSVEKLELQHLEEGSIAAFVIDTAGRDINCHLSDKLTSQGVVISSISDAMKGHEELIGKHLFQLVGRQTGKFEAMNAALWNDGIFVYVPDNKTIEKPIHLLREAGPKRTTTFPRLLVVLGQNAEATFVDEYAGGGQDPAEGFAYSNGAVELFGGQDSRMRYVSLQRQDRGTISYLTHRARIDRGATMTTIPLALGASISKQNFGVVLGGTGSTSRMYGLLFGTGRQHFDNHTLHHHASGQTYSDIDFKVVLRDRSRSAYTGLIKIDQSAQTCEAYQENRNLLLNQGAKAESIPELEILNEDVSCSHGATVGPIDEMQVFYLTSRGIEREEAIRMVVSGFVSSTIKLIPEDLRERVSDVIETRLKDI